MEIATVRRIEVAVRSSVAGQALTQMWKTHRCRRRSSLPDLPVRKPPSQRKYWVRKRLIQSQLRPLRVYDLLGQSHRRRHSARCRTASLPAILIMAKERKRNANNIGISSSRRRITYFLITFSPLPFHRPHQKHRRGTVVDPLLPGPYGPPDLRIRLHRHAQPLQHLPVPSGRRRADSGAWKAMASMAGISVPSVSLGTAALPDILPVLQIPFPRRLVKEVIVPVGVEIQQDSARLQHSFPFPVRLFRMGKIPGKIPCDDHIEAAASQLQLFRVHLQEPDLPLPRSRRSGAPFPAWIPYNPQPSPDIPSRPG